MDSDRSGTGGPTLRHRSIRSNVGSMTPLGVTRSGTFYYHSSTGGLRNLYVTDLDSAQVTKTPAPGTERLVNVNVGPTWSRDGEHLAYYSFRDWSDSNTTRLTAASIRLLVIRSRKTGEERTVPLPPRVAFSVSRVLLLGRAEVVSRQSFSVDRVGGCPGAGLRILSAGDRYRKHGAAGACAWEGAPVRSVSRRPNHLLHNHGSTIDKR